MAGAMIVGPCAAWTAEEPTGPPAAAQAPAGAPVAPPALPAALPAAAPAGLPTLPGAVAAPLTATPPVTLPGAGGETETSGPTAAGAVPTPPPLPSLTEAMTGAAEGATSTGVAAPAAPLELYEFLYLKHDDYGPVRLKVTPDEAEKIHQKEVALLKKEFPTQGGAQGGMQQGQQVDPTAVTAEWDYYFEQLQLYSEYVKEVLLPEKKEDLDDPDYEVSKMDDAVQKRTELKQSYDKKAQEAMNEQRDENAAFYERMQKREDRRKRYYEWIASQQHELDEWAKVWARKGNATKWVSASGEINRDDWYYGTNFNPGEPMSTTIEGQTFVFSSEPARGVSQTELNVLSTNLTPYDILDQNGVIKNPETERARGTLVEPPAEPTPTPTPGIIQTSEDITTGSL
jgi:hypothetical protein